MKLKAKQKTELVQEISVSSVIAQGRVSQSELRMTMFEHGGEQKLKQWKQVKVQLSHAPFSSSTHSCCTANVSVRFPMGFTWYTGFCYSKILN